jgi:hypothetical protein
LVAIIFSIEDEINILGIAPPGQFIPSKRESISKVIDEKLSLTES